MSADGEKMEDDMQNMNSQNRKKSGKVDSFSEIRDTNKRKLADSAATELLSSNEIHGTPAEPSIPHWIAGNSPPKFVDLDGLMKTAVELDKMAIVHEIATNPEFSVQMPLPMEGTLHRKVHDAMHAAFWNSLKSDIDANPPVYDHAFALLMEIKSILLSLLLPRHTRLVAEIEENLDEQLLKQRVEKHCFDCSIVIDYILGVMSQLCAPIRDKKITQLKEKRNDMVAFFRGIFEVLDFMKLDLANFTITQNRSVIQRHSAEYEREKFQKFIDKWPEGLKTTNAWLRSAFNEWKNAQTDIKSEPSAKKLSELGESSEIIKEKAEEMSRSDKNKVISIAYVRLFDWPEEVPFPESLVVDGDRLSDLRRNCLILIVTTSAIMLTSNVAGRDVAELIDFKSELKDKLTIILDQCNNSTLSEHLPNVAAQCSKDVQEALNKLPNSPSWTRERAIDLKSQIIQLTKFEHPVRKVIHDRIHSFILSLIANPDSNPIKIPSGLGVIQSELAKLSGAFLRLVSYNRQVFFGSYSYTLSRFSSDDK